MTTHNPKVTGSWSPADGTKSTLELAKTEDPNLLGLRNSHTPQEVIFVTPQMTKSFIHSATEGQLRHMI